MDYFVLTLKFIPDAGQEAELVKIFLRDSIVAAGVLEGQAIGLWKDRIDFYEGVFDVFLIRCVGQVVDLAEECKVAGEALFQRQIQLGEGFRPDIQVVVGGYLRYPVAGIGQGQLDVQADFRVFEQQGNIAGIVGLTL